MSRHSASGRVQFPSPSNVNQKQKQQTPRKFDQKPLFMVQNFDQPSFSGYNQRAAPLMSLGKRKSDSPTSFSRVKQHITEERITNSMQQLSLHHNEPTSSRDDQHRNNNNTNRGMDEGFFEDLNDSISEEELDDGCHDDEWLRSTTVVNKIQFAPGVKESLLKLDEQSFIPKKIVEDMNRSSLALIPYTPPPVINQLQNVSDDVPDQDIEWVFNKNQTSNYSFNVKGEMDVDEMTNEKT